MDLLGFVTTWFWYVMAFAAGMLVAWLVARQFVPARSPQEAIDDALDRRSSDDQGLDDDDAYDDDTTEARR